MFANPTIIGESFIGEGAEAAHLNVVLGRRGSPVETAWVGSLAAPRAGHVPFLTVLRPGLPVKPPPCSSTRRPSRVSGTAS